MKKKRTAVLCACGAVPVLKHQGDGFVVVCPNAPPWYVTVGQKTEEKEIKVWNDLQNGMDWPV